VGDPTSIPIAEVPSRVLYKSGFQPPALSFTGINLQLYLLQNFEKDCKENFQYAAYE